MSPAPPPDARPADSVRSDGSLLSAVHGGNPDAAARLYKRYAARVRALARANLSRGVAGRVDPDDIVQSVFRRFFAAAKQGRYQLPSGEELWDLLLVITLNKLRSEEQFHRAGKRDVRQTVGWDAVGADPGGRRDDGPDAFLEVAVAEALGRLPDHYREVVGLRMDGYEVAEIAAKTARSKRTVERMLQEARARLGALLQVET